MKRLLLFAITLIFLVPAANAQIYSITDLGPLHPTAINTWAQVAGSLNGGAYLRSPTGRLQSLGILAGGTNSAPLGLNDRGTVVGIADGTATVTGGLGGPATCPDAIQGFEWTSSGGMQGMGQMTFGDDNPCELGGGVSDQYSFANGVDGSNHVLGTIYWASDTYVSAFGWTNPTIGIVLLPVPNVPLAYALTEANGINNRNQMVGAVGCCADLAQGHALYWNNKVISDLGTLGGADSDFDYYCSNARAINDLDQIVGWSTTVPGSGDGLPCFDWASELPHAFSWTKAHGMQDLGTLPGDSMSMAYGINFFGQVIGTSGSDTMEPEYKGIEYGGLMSTEVVGRPFLWTQKTGMRDLNALIPSGSGWILKTANAINVWGQIVGSGIYNGKTHGFLLTPKL